MTELMQNGFYNNHCPINNKPEIQSPETHQVSADSEKIHHTNRKSIARGITDATNNPARKFPRNKTIQKQQSMRLL
jgi:hypothetical protein